MLVQFIKNELLADQVPELLQWMENNPGDLEEILNSGYVQEIIHSAELTIPDELQEKLRNDLLYKIRTKEEPRRYFRLAPWMRVAALFLLLAGAGALVKFLTFEKEMVANVPDAVKEQIHPGTNRAYLHLANGQLIYLDSSGNGELAQQGTASIIKKDDQLLYNNTSGSAESLPEMNTLQTPRGGQFRLVLPDGSRVWLNAASSISFPTAFHSKQRRVKITGEVYFEIERDVTRPFIVSLKPDTEVEVLGTSFNVQSYPDEHQIKTTLLEGSIKLLHNKGDVKLKPGQQGEIQAGTNTGIRINDNADLEDVMAWKNGYFSFKMADLSVIMRQLSRWYDVDVVYRGTVPKRSFGGEISRSASLSEVLSILEESKINFTIENKTIIVQP